MYDELVKSLRVCGRMTSIDDNCISYVNGCCEAFPDCAYALMDQAADAIEELSASVEGFEAQTNMVLDRDGNNTVIRFEPRWIPVTERLPEEDGDYLVWFYDARCWKVAEYNKHTAKERHAWWLAGIDRTKFVTHWMPLPEPPKEES